MAKSASLALRRLPSVDQVLRTRAAMNAVNRFGRPAVVAAVRGTLAAARADGMMADAADQVVAAVLRQLEAQQQPNLRPVFNLTGTVLHTNLGRALLADAAIEAARTAMG